MLKWILIVLVLVVAGGTYMWWSDNHRTPQIDVTIMSFEDCALAGNPVMESAPRQCRTADGRLFVEQTPLPDTNNIFITNAGESDMIRVTTPDAETMVTSPLSISGEARGMWYFEASFPVELLDDEGNIIASGIATAKDEWMTEEYVPFESQLDFVVPEGVTRGVIVLRRDNPSDLPENDDFLEIPVRFDVALVTEDAPLQME